MKSFIVVLLDLFLSDDSFCDLFDHTNKLQFSKSFQSLFTSLLIFNQLFIVSIEVLSKLDTSQDFCWCSLVLIRFEVKYISKYLQEHYNMVYYELRSILIVKEQCTTYYYSTQRITQSNCNSNSWGQFSGWNWLIAAFLYLRLQAVGVLSILCNLHSKRNPPQYPLLYGFLSLNKCTHSMGSLLHHIFLRLKSTMTMVL